MTTRVSLSVAPHQYEVLTAVALAETERRPSLSALARGLGDGTDVQSILARYDAHDIKRAQARIDHELEAAARIDGVSLVTVLDEEYPPNLRAVGNLPPFLFVRGELLAGDARSVAVVGTRQASEIGLRRSARMARLLVDHGVTVVSGLALGVDTAAHKAALAGYGRTVAALGTGIAASCYPRENARLLSKIAEHGAVVSQFWPTQGPTRWTFPARNVVSSGIAQGTVVIEAGPTSGAKMQARIAHEHGKLVFLVRSLVVAEQWARDYVERGIAVEVLDVEDVVSRLR